MDFSFPFAICELSFSFAEINTNCHLTSLLSYTTNMIQDLMRPLCYCPGAFCKTEPNGQYSSRYVCGEGKICYAALDETYRNCYVVAFRRPELLGWYWGRAKAFRSPWSSTGMILEFVYYIIHDFLLILVTGNCYKPICQNREELMQIFHGWTLWNAKFIMAL